jgi:hypothetical protein
MKSGSYEVTDDGEQPLVYCEKCAILLASQGFKVSKITKESCSNSFQQSIQRKDELNNMINLTNQTTEALI